jgi:hypothetical protein
MEGIVLYYGVVFGLVLLIAARAVYLTIRATGKDDHQRVPSSRVEG